MCCLPHGKVVTTDNRGTDEAMVLESQMLSLHSPSSRTLKDFKRSFKQDFKPSSKPSSTAALWHRDEHLFDKEHDLVALAPVDTDRINLFLKSYFAWFFKVCEASFKIPRIYLPDPPARHRSKEEAPRYALCPRQGISLLKTFVHAAAPEHR